MTPGADYTASAKTCGAAPAHEVRYRDATVCSQAKGSGIVAWEGRETNTSHSHTRMIAGQKYIRTMSESPPPWTERHDSAVRTLHPTLAGQKLGVSVKMIKARRKQLKLP
jgi:hypothetical protein